jgi:hypothetical protein
VGIQEEEALRVSRAMNLDRRSPYDAKLYRMTSEACYSPDRISGSCELGISIRVDARDEATAHASETCCSGGETRLRLQTASSVRHGASGIGIDAGGEDSGFLLITSITVAFAVPIPLPVPVPVTITIRVVLPGSRR